MRSSNYLVYFLRKNMQYDNILERMCTISHIDESDEYNIAVSLNKNLFNGLLVLIVACAKNFQKKINLFILQDGLTGKQIELLSSHCKSFNVVPYIITLDPAEFSKLGHHRLPAAAFYYFKVGKLLPLWVKRVLYLDIDTLPLKDIKYFYNIDFEGSWLVATNEYNAPFFNNYFKDKINCDFTYKSFYSSEMIFNSGVLLLNVDKFREFQITLKDFEKIVKKEDALTLTADQIILNRFTGTDIKLIPKAYFNCWVGHTISSLSCFNNLDKSNEVYSYFQKNSELELSIIHFTAFPSVKPWHSLKAILECKLEFTQAATGKYASCQTNDEINKYVGIWWDYAKCIPTENYGELVAQSIKLNCDKSLHAERRFNHLKDVFAGYANIAPLGKATQSSISQWSQGHDEANCALIGKLKDGCDHAIHTKFDKLAWWKVDLQASYKIKLVKLFNRDHFRERYTAEKIEIMFSLDEKNWVDFGHPHEADNGATYVLEVPCQLFKFVKIQVHNMALHFKRIGIYI